MISKKGFSAITEIVFAVSIVLLGILLIATLVKTKEDAQTENSEQALNRALMENAIGLYLKQPVLIESQEIEMPDLIVLASADKASGAYYKEKWKEATAAFFIKSNSGIHKIETSGLRIDIPNLASSFNKGELTSSVNLPSPEGVITVKFTSYIIDYSKVLNPNWQT